MHGACHALFRILLDIGEVFGYRNHRGEVFRRGPFGMREGAAEGLDPPGFEGYPNLRNSLNSPRNRLVPG